MRIFAASLSPRLKGAGPNIELLHIMHVDRVLLDLQSCQQVQVSEIPRLGARPPQRSDLGVYPELSTGAIELIFYLVVAWTSYYTLIIVLS